VHASDDNGKDGYTTGHETDRASANGPTPKPALKSGAPAPKKRANDKDSSTKRANPTKSKTSTNSTLTGRVTKKAERKPASKTDGKFKSAEFVQESDEDDTEMADAPVPAPASEKTKPEQSKVQPKPKQTASSKVGDPSHVSTPKMNQSEAPPSKAESTSQNVIKSVAAKRPPSNRAPNQRSPQKPSPLGSSPPANASDAQSRSRSSSQNNTSSSSSSPLITQLSKPNKVTQSTGAIKTNGIAKATESVNPLKRKAETDRPSAIQSKTTGRTTGNLEHKRRRAVSTSSGSTGSASPPLSREILRQQLREKSQKFKQYYAKYRALHDSMASHPDPPRAELERLQRQHIRLQRMKKEIWDEHGRLRDGL
jgi:RNA polymerase II elongation factor ELL